MTILRSKTPKNREKRLGALSAYYGEVSELLAEGAGNQTQRIRTFSQATPDDLVYVLRLLSVVDGAVTIIHGPRGCAASQLFHEASGGSLRWAVTNLDERDTIMGADTKLRSTVRALSLRHRPQVVFIVASPTVAINNDDIQSVVEELSEELTLPIVPVYASGFASKNAVTGYDLAHHAMIKYLAQREVEHQQHVNLLAVAEHAADRDAAQLLLSDLGLEVNLLPDTATPESFSRAAGAALSIPLNPDSTNYLAELLQLVHQVPFLDIPRPIGIAATGVWLRAIGQATGREPEAAALHRQRSATLNELLVTAPLRGVRAYLSLPAADAFAVAALVQELGGELAGLSLEHFDRRHLPALAALEQAQPGLKIHVGHSQPFEEINIVRQLKPQLHVGSASHLVQVAQLGIPAFSLDNRPLIGYAGVVGFARQAMLALRNPAFVRALSAAPSPYQDSWFQRSPYWFIKQEVK